MLEYTEEADSMDKTANYFKTSKFMGVAGGALYILSLFMDAYSGVVPFVGNISVKFSYFMGNLSIILWVIGGAGIAFSIMRMWIGQMVTGGLGLGFAILVRVILNPKLEDPALGVQLDIAPYMLFIASGLILASGILCIYAECQIGRDDAAGIKVLHRVKKAFTPEQIEAKKQRIKTLTLQVVRTAAPIVGLIALITLIAYVFHTVIPRSHYNKGMEAYAIEDYSTAVEEFTKAGKYPDAAAMLVDSRIALHYQNGENALNSGDYELAHTEFLAAGSYEDASSQAAYAELGIHYSAGVSLFESGDYETAISEFEAADYFPGASNKIDQSYYQLASGQYEAGDYLSAAENYGHSNGYDDAEDMIISIGDECMAAGDYAAAASCYLFSSDERYAAYALGMEEMSNCDYNPAIDHFVTADDLLDSNDKVNECRYLYGLELIVNRDFSAAAANLQLVSGYRDADVVCLVAMAEKANQDRDITAAVSCYSQIPEDFSMQGFDVQERRTIFTSSEALAFAEFCSTYEVESIDAYCSSVGRYGTYGGWTLTEIVPDQELSFNCRYENGTYTLNGHVQFFIFEDYSPIRDLTGFDNESRNFTIEGITTPPSSYEFDDGTTISFSSNQATVHYHAVDNYSVGMNYVYDSEITFVRE